MMATLESCASSMEKHVRQPFRFDQQPGAEDRAERAADCDQEEEALVPDDAINGRAQGTSCR